MDWLHDGIRLFCNSSPTEPVWKSIADSINVNNPRNDFEMIDDFLCNKTYLAGEAISSNDFYVCYKLKQIPKFSKILSSPNRPFHLCRWFSQVNSVFPDDSFSYFVKQRQRISKLLIEALKENDMKKFFMHLEMLKQNEQFIGVLGIKPIHIACEQENLAALVMLVEKGVSIELEDDEGLTPIFYTLRGRNLDIFNYLISIGANIHHKDKQNRSLFYFAVSSMKFSFVKILLDLGCNVNSSTTLGSTPLSKAAWNGDTKIVELLLSVKGIEIDKPDSRLRTPLHNAVWGCASRRPGTLSLADSSECAKLLIDAGASIEALDDTGNNPLCIAAYSCAINSLELLLEYNANKYHFGKDGYTPLHQALIRSHLNCASILIQNGIDPNLSCKDGRSCLQVAIAHEQERSVIFLLDLEEVQRSHIDVIFCIRHGSSKILELLINRIGTPDDFFEKCITEGNDDCALWAVRNKSSLSYHEFKSVVMRSKAFSEIALPRWVGNIKHEILEKLLDYDLDIEKIYQIVKPTRKTLQIAINKGKEELAMHILSCIPDLYIEKDSKSGRTALHFAAEKGLCNLASHLVGLSNNPSEYINLQDSQGLSSIIIAEHHGYWYLSAFLKDFHSQSSNNKIVSYITQIEYEEVYDQIPTYPTPLSEMKTAFYEINIKLRELNETELIWVDNQIAFEEMASYFNNISVIGVDLEYYSFEPRKGCISLIQLSSGERDFVIDPFVNRSKIAAFMKELMIDSTKTKALHGADSDLLWLQNDFLAYSANIFDTARASKLITGENDCPSLASLIYEYLGLKIDKSFQVSDWRIRPLPSPMLNYARIDAHYLPYLYNRLKPLLNPQNLEEFFSILNSMCHKNPTGKLIRLKILNCG
ncbi:unnamed protein product [Blepharisma stoltei]|uniref:3'-5' exonuclease domain-containing protein n=1 Tax=Blepharisma stoltei TaxID=1481888 RepID=A0AAU9J8P4_9CILI|nr:unnamed protein product [Blepharisma stoltei]